MKYTDKLFWFACIPARVGLAYYIDGDLVLVPAIGFGIRYITGDLPDARGIFGSKIWWHDMRLIHALVWYSAYMHPEYRREILLSDVAIGIGAKLLIAP